MMTGRLPGAQVARPDAPCLTSTFRGPHRRASSSRFTQRATKVDLALVADPSA